MNQEQNFPAVTTTSLTSLNNNNDQSNQSLSANLLEILNNNNNNNNNNNDDDWKSAEGDDDDHHSINDIQGGLTATAKEQNNNEGWANFNTFESHMDSKSENTLEIESNTVEDDWGSFTSNPIQSTHDIIKSTNSEQSKLNGDTLNKYDVMQIAPQSQVSSEFINCLNTESIESLISTCFPLDSLTESDDTDNYIPLELPSFSSWKNHRKSLSCFKPTLSLWKMLSNIAYDPIGIQYQWRKSNMEHLFHRALGVHKRLHTQIIPSTSNKLGAEIQITISKENNENKTSEDAISQQFDWKKNDLENSAIDDNSSTLSIKSNHSDDNIFDVSKSFDMDYYSLSIKNLTLKKEESDHSPITAHRNTSAIVQQNSTPIKTIHLFPGSSRIFNEDAKSVVDTVPNFSSMNPKELMFRTKN